VCDKIVLIISSFIVVVIVAKVVVVVAAVAVLEEIVWLWCFVNKKLDAVIANNFNSVLSNYYGGTWWRSWLKYCATNGKIAYSISGEVTGIFH
jgi:hypothetical protein